MVLFPSFWLLGMNACVPEYWKTSSHLHIAENGIRTSEYYLGLDEVGDVGELIDSARLEPRAMESMSTPRDDDDVDIGVIRGLASLLDKTANDGNGPEIIDAL